MMLLNFLVSIFGKNETCGLVDRININEKDRSSFFRKTRFFTSV
jgi:hypothetical protein